MPAHGASAHSRQHDATLPGFAQNNVELMRSPDSEEIGDRPAAHPQHVLGEQMRTHITHVWLRKKLQMAWSHVFADAGRVEPRYPGGVIASGCAEITHLRSRLASELEPIAHNGA